jgi:hypothetical protein
VFRRVVDYARARRRPSVSPEEKPMVIESRMNIRAARSTEMFVIEIGKNKKKPGEPPGIVFRVLALV